MLVSGESKLDCDIAVIGASSAGLDVALQLARAGRRVSVFEQKPSAHTARRTLIVTPAFHSHFSNLPPAVLLHRVGAIQLTTRARSVRVPLAEPDLIIERSGLIEYLADQATANGVQIFYGHRFQTMEADPDGARLYFKNAEGKTISPVARTVIGADGIGSEVGAAVGIPPVPTAPLVQAEIKLPDDWDPTLTQVWFDTDETGYFFWLIPESAERGVVGLVGDSRARISDVLQKFMRRHGFKPLGYQAGTVAMYERRLRTSAHFGAARILLVGDAAGHVKVTTVGGTVSGMLGGQAAVRAILQDTRYEAALRGVEQELWLHWLMRRVLQRMDNTAYDRLAGAVDAATAEFLGKHNRDEMALYFWKFLLRRPKLLAQLATSLAHLPVRSRTVSNTLPTIKEL